MKPACGERSSLVWTAATARMPARTAYSVSIPASRPSASIVTSRWSGSIRLGLPAWRCPPVAVFGPKSQAEIATLQEAVERAITRDDNAKTVAIYFTAPAEEWDLAVARRLRHQLHSWESVGHLVQLHLLESTVSSLPRDQKEWLAKLAFNGVQICLHNSIPDLGALALNVSLQGPQGCIAWASDNTNLAAPGHTWDLAEAGARIIRGTPPTSRQSAS